MKKDLSPSSSGVSPLVANVLLISIMIMAITVLSYQVISEQTVRERFVDFDVRLENTSSSDNVKIILMHGGGSDIEITDDDELEDIRVTGRPPKWEENKWENYVPSWQFSEPEDGFELGENAVGYIRHNSADIPIGYKLWITIASTRTDKIFVNKKFEVENSSLY